MPLTGFDADHSPTSDSPIEVLAQYFSGHGWSFEREGDEEIVTTVKGSWSDYELRGLWREDDQVLQFIAKTGINASATRKDAETRANLFEVLGLVNEQLWIGHFEHWSGDGALLFRHAVLVDEDEGCHLSLAQVHALVDAAIEECERYYPAFQFVLWGGKGPREALAAAMVETEGEA